MLLNDGLLPIRLLYNWQTFGSLVFFSFVPLHGVEGAFLLLRLLELLVNVAGGGGADHSAALDPVAGVWYEVVRVVLAELVRAGLNKLVLYI